MKNIVVIFLINLTLGLTLPISVKAADVFKNDVSSADVLNFTIKGLKESALEVSQNNKWLKAEIDLLKRKINFVQSEIAALSDQGQNLNLQPKDDLNLDRTQELSYWQKGSDRLAKGLSQLTQEQTKLEETLEQRKFAEQELRLQIKNLQDEMSLIKSNLNQASVAMKDESKTKDKDKLEVSLRDVQKSLVAKQKELDQVKKRVSGPANQIKILSEEQERLKMQIQELSQNSNSQLDRSNQLQRDMDEIKEKNQKEIFQLEEDITRLNDERDQLAMTLREARQKIQGARLMLVEQQEEEGQLLRNLKTIQKENSSLKQQIETSVVK